MTKTKHTSVITSYLQLLQHSLRLSSWLLVCACRGMELQLGEAAGTAGGRKKAHLAGSGICVQRKRRDWKLLRMEWMFAMLINTTSQLG